MPVEVGVFQSETAALDGIKKVLSTGVARDKITILTPQATSRELAAVPLSDSEQPGMGSAMGTVVGGAPSPRPEPKASTRPASNGGSDCAAPKRRATREMEAISSATK